MYAHCLRLGGIAALLVVVSATSGFAAPTADQKCRATKLKASGKYAASVLGCDSKAAKVGSAIDSECLSKGNTKRSGAFATAEDKNGDCNGLDATSASIVHTTAAEIAALVPVPGSGGDCASAIRKASGKFASGLLGAWSKFTTGGDATKREEAVAKSRGKLAGAITKAEEDTGCSASGYGEAVRAVLEEGLLPLIACIGSTVECVEVAANVGAGGTATTDGDAGGATVDEPMTASLETPNAGDVVLRIIESSVPAPNGFAVMGTQFDITAPAATVENPLVLTFVLDASTLPGDPNEVAITRDGTLVEDCTAAPGIAGPDPCFQSRTVLGSGDLELVVLSSHASLWTPLVEAPLTCPTKMLWELRADAVGDDRATEMDVGWAGRHDMDSASGSPVTFAMDCHGATESPCGTCDVTGFDAAAGNCRCANNTRTVCDEPLVADNDDCGGAVCQCYTRAPSPVVVQGTPVCMYSLASSQASGTWNVEAGSGDVVLNEFVRLHLGDSLFLAPCPTCEGDVPGDGVRGGICINGQSGGLSCDATASDPTYPAPGGGYYSLDCLPSSGTNITGLGVSVAHTETTGTSTLASGIPCTDGLGSMCPCAVCSGNTSIACSNDAQCALQSAGTCTAHGFGVPTSPNNCPGEACTVGPDGEGECTVPNFDMYCDGLLEEDGRGIVSCFDDSGCQVGDYGACTVAENRECFGATISATGAPDPHVPLTVGTACVPATSNAAANTVNGLPGPARLRNEWYVTQLP
ncbi:MAG: hypothetical protein ABR538_14860 [Candidatus Binatia bacterium]